MGFSTGALHDFEFIQALGRSAEVKLTSWIESRVLFLRPPKPDWFGGRIVEPEALSGHGCKWLPAMQSQNRPRAHFQLQR